MIKIQILCLAIFLRLSGGADGAESGPRLLALMEGAKKEGKMANWRWEPGVGRKSIQFIPDDADQAAFAVRPNR